MNRKGWKEALKTDNIKRKKPCSAWELLSNGMEQLYLDDFKDVLGHHEVIVEALECRDLRAKLKSEALYELYVIDQRDEIEEIRKDEQLEIPTDLAYFNLQELSMEDREKEILDVARPSTIAAVSRLPGVTPTA